MWSVTAYDWSAKSSDAIVNHAVRQMGSRKDKQGEIILLHDGGHVEFGADRSHTVEATRGLLERYSGEGKKFVSIPEFAR